jgi:rare lipoprotein A
MYRIIILLIVLTITGCSKEVVDVSVVQNHLPYNEDKILYGVASYYDYVLDGGWSSVGHYVCATRDFIRYSYVEATNVANGKTVICKVTDYGPDESVFPDRIIDLSSTAFSAISDTKLGVANVAVKQIMYVQ